MYINPYKNNFFSNTEPLKANFHIHAGLEGDHNADEVIASYKEAGYDVLMISNQYVLTDTQVIQKKHDIVMFNGFEYVDDKDILCVDVNNYFDGNRQDVINQCNSLGGFSILAHPNFTQKGWWPLDAMSDLKGYIGIEIYNGVIFRMEGSGLAVDVWDFLLSNGKLIWGFANDDFHRWFDMARGWNIVHSNSKEKEDIKRAINQGSFYASTGLSLKDFIFENDILRISARAKGSYIKDYTYRFIGDNGKILKQEYAEFAEYKINGNEKYIRVEVTSEHGAMLWTQPIYDNEIIS